MGKINMVCRSITNYISKNSPAILTGIGIIGMGTCTVLACKATPKYYETIHQEEARKGQKLTIWETFKEGAMVYWPAATIGLLSASCLIFGNTISNKRNTALVAAYTLTEGKLKDYQEEIINTVGEKKAESIKQKISEKKIKENPPTANQLNITNDKDVLCYDSLSGRYFKACSNKIERAEAAINRRLINECRVTVNDLYEELDCGLDPIAIGDDLGWHMFSTDDIIQLDITHAKVTETGQPCIVLDYNIQPMWINVGDD